MELASCFAVLRSVLNEIIQWVNSRSKTKLHHAQEIKLFFIKLNKITKTSYLSVISQYMSSNNLGQPLN